MNKYNEKYMELAIEMAKKAFENGEVPVGCVIVKNDTVLSAGYNQKECLNMATRHAEIIAIEDASKKCNNWRLIDCDIYITLEPCPMCASAIKQSRICNVYCGLKNSDTSNSQIVEKIFLRDNTNGNVNLFNNLMPDQVTDLMRKFFKNKRNIK